jgi:hypothetical protein
MYANSKNKRKDNVFVNAKIVSLEELTNIPTISSKSQVIISEDVIVNVVSDKYGFLPNERYYTAVEEKLINAEISYSTQSINKENKSFKVDYILGDDYATTIGTKDDKIVPLMSFTNSYDGSSKTTGTFGLYRQVCSNGLMVADTKVGFSIKHIGNQVDIIMPEIDRLIQEFTKTEYYELQKKFEILAGRKINNVQKFVEQICQESKIFKFESNPESQEVVLTKKAEAVIDIINRESSLLKVEPNMWLGYNAFNEIIHSMNMRNFETKNEKDHKMFETILEFA